MTQFDAGVRFLSSGSLEARSGTLRFDGVPVQISGVMEFGIAGPAEHGRVHFAGAPPIFAAITASPQEPEGLAPGQRFEVLNQGARLRESVVFGGRDLGDGLVYEPEWSEDGLVFVLRSAVSPTAPAIQVNTRPGLPCFVLVEGPPGLKYHCSFSEDFRDWNVMATNGAPAGVCEFRDFEGSFKARRFYRVLGWLE